MLSLRACRAGLFFWSLIFLLRAPLSAQTLANPVEITVDARRAPSGIIETTMYMPVRPGPLTLHYPKWIPGEHGPTGPVRDLVGLKMRVDGKELEWERNASDMFSFQVVVPPGGSRMEISLQYLVPSREGGFTSGRSATRNLVILSWNQFLLYPAGHPAADLMLSARLRLPQDWRFGTALPVARNSPGTIEFETVSLETLVDSPVLAGAYLRTVGLDTGPGPAHYIEVAVENEALLEGSENLTLEYGWLVKEAGALFGTHHYEDYRFLLTLSDHVAHFGLEHHASSDNRVSERSLDNFKSRSSFGGLLAHELVHSWNGKFRRPAGMTAPDYQTTLETGLLWVYEGLTDYLGSVLAARSGLWSSQDFRDDLAATAAYLDIRKGRSWRSLADTAVSAQVLFGAPAAWSDWRRGTDFYDESSLIWLEADVIIRQQSEGELSLDDFCQRFYGSSQNGNRVVPYTLDDLVDTLNSVVPHDWKSFFEERLGRKGAGAPLGGVEGSGWKLVYRDEPSERFRANQKVSGGIDARYSIGLVADRSGAVRDMLYDGPAARAGIVPGMKLVAVNGLNYSPERLREAIQANGRASEGVELQTERQGYHQSHRIQFQGGERFPHLERDPSRPDLLGEIILRKSK